MPAAAPIRRKLPLWVSLLAYLALLAAAGVVIVWQGRRISQLAALVSERARSEAQLRAQLKALAAAPAPAEPAPAREPQRAAPSEAADSAEALAAAKQQAQRLRDALDQSNADLARLQSQITDLQARIDSTSAENRRLNAAVDAARRDFADANQTIESLRQEIRANADRATQLESAAAKQRQEALASRQSTTQLNQTVSDLEGVFRRREMYLNDTLLRYREITEQYRAISGVMDSRRDRQSAPVSSPELSRIQNAIALAEEDLKQIHALDAQVQRLQKKLPVK